MAQNYMIMPLEELKILSYEELLEAKTEVESIDPLDVNRYNIIVNTLSEKEPNVATLQDATFTQTNALRTPYEFVQKFNFDEYAGTSDNILNNVVQSMLNKKAESVSEQVSEQYEVKLARLQSEIDTIRENYESKLKAAEEENRQTTTERNTFELERDDFEKRFKAATIKIDELQEQSAQDKAEIERLKNRETELQRKLADAPAPTAREIIDITAESLDLDEMIRKANERKAAEQKRKEEERLAARPKITNKRFEKEFGVGAKTVYLAELVGNYPGVGNDGDTIRIGLYDINQYVEVSAEEASRFRAEQAANAAIEVAAATQEVPNIPLDEPLTVPELEEVHQFPKETEVLLPGTDHDTVPGEVAEQTLEEAFRQIEKLTTDYQELKGRVDTLQARVG